MDISIAANDSPQATERWQLPHQSQKIGDYASLLAIKYKGLMKGLGAIGLPLEGEASSDRLPIQTQVLSVLLD